MEILVVIITLIFIVATLPMLALSAVFGINMLLEELKKLKQNINKK